MKKLLVLSGDPYHILFIKKAVDMGHYVITCDFFEHNPGHKFAHEYHNISYMDKEAVLALAKELQIDGITCFAADEASMTVAYVAEQLGLPTHPIQSINIISNKEKFRQFLKDNNFCVPYAKGFSSFQEVKSDIQYFNMPIMVKPIDSSASRGVAKIDSIDQLQEKIENALSFSKSKRFLIEEYIEKKGYQVGGDGFSVNGKLVFSCFSNNHFDNLSINPFIPLGGSWPSKLSSRIQNKINSEIQRVLDLLKMGTGAYNFDIRVDENENVYLIEMAARNGGNRIPQITKYATKVDLIEYTIKAALGEDCSDLKSVEPNGHWSCYTINSQKSGVFKGIEIDDTFLKNNVVEYELLVKPGNKISAFTGSDKKLGSMVLKFSTMEEMLEKMDDMNRWLNIVVE